MCQASLARSLTLYLVVFTLTHTHTHGRLYTFIRIFFHFPQYEQPTPHIDCHDHNSVKCTLNPHYESTQRQ